jgi:DNA-binding NarL/FixJ family response regulator
VTAAAAPLRLLLVEDSEVYRESLVLLLGRVDGIEVVGAVGTGAAAGAACAELGADVAVIDYRLPDVDGTEAAEDVRQRCPGAAIVFLSASAGEGELAAARALDAPLVRKDAGLEALLQAVRATRADGA